MSISVAASFLGVCTKTLRRWHATGVFEPDFRTLNDWDVVYCPSCKKKMNAHEVAAIQIAARKKPFKFETGLFSTKPNIFSLPGSHSLPILDGFVD
ncbi:MAG: hypothetical protein ACTSRW_10890 [Candidatus Helarchaeota archaeon]